MTGPEGRQAALHDYAAGRIASDTAMRRTRLRDYASLLVALGDADLSPPRPPEEVIEAEADRFAAMWAAHADDADASDPEASPDPEAAP